MSRLKTYKLYKQAEQASDMDSFCNNAILKADNPRDTLLLIVKECLARDNIRTLAKLCASASVAKIANQGKPFVLDTHTIKRLQNEGIDLTMFSALDEQDHSPNDAQSLHGWLENSNPCKQGRYYPPASSAESLLEKRAVQCLGKTPLPLIALLIEGDYYGFIALAYHGYALNDFDKALAWCAFNDLKEKNHTAFEWLHYAAVRENVRCNYYHERLTYNLDPATFLYAKEWYSAVKAQAFLLEDDNPPNVVEYKDALFQYIEGIYTHWVDLQKLSHTTISDNELFTM